jgi:SAM-dependent methyltransferase
MTDPDDRRPVRAAAKRLYGAGQQIWDPADDWNRIKSEEVSKFGERYAGADLRRAKSILDAGCGRDGYPWLPPHRISFDRFQAQVAPHQWPVVGSVEALPFRDGAFEYVVCVGAVLNYVSGAEALSELSRVSSHGAKLLLHFESSKSFEHVLTRRWNQPVVRIATTNSGRPDTIWVYRPTYIYDLLHEGGFKILHKRCFHIASAAALRLGFGQQQASKWAKWDRFVPWAGALADDVILLAEKTG